MLLPTLNITEPNEAYDAKTSPFVFGDAARPWVGDDRRSAVSAVGFGGANFHAVLAAYRGGDEPAHGLDEWSAELFLVRAATAAEARPDLERLVARCATPTTAPGAPGGCATWSARRTSAGPASACRRPWSPTTSTTCGPSSSAPWRGRTVGAGTPLIGLGLVVDHLIDPLVPALGGVERLPAAGPSRRAGSPEP